MQALRPLTRSFLIPTFFCRHDIINSPACLTSMVSRGSLLLAGLSLSSQIASMGLSSIGTKVKPFSSFSCFAHFNLINRINKIRLQWSSNTSKKYVPSRGSSQRRICTDLGVGFPDSKWINRENRELGSQSPIYTRVLSFSYSTVPSQLIHPPSPPSSPFMKSQLQSSSSSPWR